MIPIVLAYRKYYGWPFAIRIVALMFVTIVIAALIVDGLFGIAGLIPSTRPSRSDIFGSVQLDYKLVLNAVGLAVFAVLMYLAKQTRAAQAAERPETAASSSATRGS